MNKDLNNKTQLFNYTVNGVTLGAHELMEISKYYEACCTAEYILENDDYGIHDVDEALEIGYEVRELMVDDTNDGDVELDCIEDVLNERRSREKVKEL